MTKYNADKTRHAKESEITEGNTVLLKQQAENKLSPTFKCEPYQVLSKRGNIVTIQRDGVQYKRNITYVKKYHKEHDSHPTEPCENLDMNRDRDDDVGPTTPNIDDRATENVKLRPTRMTKLPSRFDDFVMT